jgi:hypothetical protein
MTGARDYPECQMNIEFLVEERSAEEALRELLPKLLAAPHTWMIHAYQGKQDLLEKLPARLRGYAKFIPATWAIVVVVDADAEDCLALKARLEEAAHRASLQTTARALGGARVQVVNRIAVEELEAWLLGDADAVRAAYPRVLQTFEEKRRFRDPDAIRGGTWEALQQLLQRAGYYPQGMPKIEVAKSIAQHMDPQRNRSGSFRCFIEAVAELTASA